MKAGESDVFSGIHNPYKEETMQQKFFKRAEVWIAGLLFPAIAAWAGEKEVPPTVSAVFPSLSSGALSKAKFAELPQDVLLRSGDLEIKAAEVDKQIKQAPANMREQFEKNRFFMLENIATEKLLLQAAKNAGKTGNGITDNEAINAYLMDIAAKASVSAEEIKSFYEENKAMMDGLPLEQVKAEIQRYILQQKQENLVKGHIRTLGDHMAIYVNRLWTEEQAKQAMDNPVDRARTSGKPSMVDFGAHGCGPCDMMTPILENMKKKYAGTANILFVPVREEQILSARYGIRSIPVQIFFNKSGEEIFRHTGFFPQEECEKWLRKAGGE